MINLIKITMKDGNIYEFTNCDRSYDKSFYSIIIIENKTTKKIERFSIKQICRGILIYHINYFYTVSQINIMWRMFFFP
jgi:hypothetical protein